LAQLRDAGVVDEAAGETSLLPLFCVGHAAVLGRKPIIVGQSCASKLVRLGHQFESGRRALALEKALDAEINARFRHREALQLSPEETVWKDEHRRILHLSRAALGLTPHDEEVILAADGGCWRDREIIHLCVVGSCPSSAAARRSLANKLS
jgi:hypothetical protein